MRNLHQLMQGFLDKRWDVAGCFLAVAGVVVAVWRQWW